MIITVKIKVDDSPTKHQGTLSGIVDALKDYNVINISTDEEAPAGRRETEAIKRGRSLDT